MNFQTKTSGCQNGLSEFPRGIELIKTIIPWAIFCFLTCRLLIFINHYAVNVLFYDEWDFYLPLFNHENIWKVFSRQHGPHRMGLGLLIMDIINRESAWNSRWIAFTIGYSLVFSTGLATWLAVKQGYRFGISLVFCSLLFLNLRQFEQFLGAVSLTPQVLPGVLLLLVCLCWYIKTPWIRILLIVVFTFNLVFTGFGLFAACIIPWVVLADLLAAYREKKAVQLIAGLLVIGFIGLTWILFFKGYVFASANPTFRFPYPKPWEYFFFMGSMASNSIGIPGNEIYGKIFGMLFCLILAIIMLKSGLGLLRNNGDAGCKVIFTLAAFTIVYSLNTAVGRISLGPTAPLVSRYVTLMILGSLALFLNIRNWSKNDYWPVIATALLAISIVSLHQEDLVNIDWYYKGKSLWKQVYLKSHDEKLANQQANFCVYPKAGVISGRLNYLEKSKLNLFQ